MSTCLTEPNLCLLLIICLAAGVMVGAVVMAIYGGLEDE